MKPGLLSSASRLAVFSRAEADPVSDLERAFYGESLPMRISRTQRALGEGFESQMAANYRALYEGMLADAVEIRVRGPRLNRNPYWERAAEEMARKRLPRQNNPSTTRSPT